MDDFMDTLLKKEFVLAEIPDAGFSERVMQGAFQGNRERIALIVGGVLAGTLIALISVPDIFGILSAQISSLSQAGIQTISIPESQPWIARISQMINNQASILAALCVAFLAPVFLLVLEE